MNLDTLVRAGQPPWHPVPEAEDIDVWDKFDFPSSGTYRLNAELIVFTLITTAASRSLWAYVPATPDAAKVITSGHQFGTEEQFRNFLDGCFAGQATIFAAAENFVISTKSDGIRVPSIRNGLIFAGTKWYLERSAALNAELQKQLSTARSEGEEDALVHAAQGALASLPA